MPTILPVRGASETAERFLDRLLPQLRKGLDGGTADRAGVVYDSQGREIAGPSGLFAYVGDRLVVAPDIVQIDTADLVDAAIETAKLADDAVTAAKVTKTGALITLSAQIQDAVIVTAKIADAAIVTAKIDDLAVNNAKIANVSVGKLTAGTIGANAIYVGNNRLELDGINGRLVIRDAQATPATRVELGTLTGGGNGIIIRDASGNILLQSGSTAYLSGAYIDSLSASQISTTSLSAISANLGTVTAGSIQSGTVTVGSTGRVTLDGTNNRITVSDGTRNRVLLGNNAGVYGLTLYDASGNVVLSSGSSTTIKGTYIDSLAVSQLAAGTIRVGAIYIANNRLELDGVNGRITIKDTQTTPATRVEIGALSGGGNGIVIKDASGNVILASGSTASISGTFIDNLSADKINAGTMTSRTVQTAASGTRIVMDASAHSIRFFQGASSSSNIWLDGTTGVEAIFAKAGPIGFFSNANTTGTDAHGVYGVANSNVGNSAGVAGFSPHGWGGYFTTTDNAAIYAECPGTGRGKAKIATYDGYAGYSLYGSWTPFTGSHDGLVRKGFTFSPGDIVVDVRVVATSEIIDAITEVELSSVPNQRAAIGVVERVSPLGDADNYPAAFRDDPSQIDVLRDDYDRCNILAVGEGLINACGEGGDIEAGDLLVTSSIPGKAKKQDDDLVRCYTVARARESVSFTAPGEVKQIACIYLCG